MSGAVRLPRWSGGLHGSTALWSTWKTRGAVTAVGKIWDVSEFRRDESMGIFSFDILFGFDRIGITDPVTVISAAGSVGCRCSGCTASSAAAGWWRLSTRRSFSLVSAG